MGFNRFKSAFSKTIRNLNLRIHFLDLLKNIIEHYCRVGSETELSFQILFHPNQGFDGVWTKKMCESYPNIEFKLQKIVCEMAYLILLIWFLSVFELECGYTRCNVRCEF